MRTLIFTSIISLLLSACTALSPAVNKKDVITKFDNPYGLIVRDREDRNYRFCTTPFTECKFKQYKVATVTFESGTSKAVVGIELEVSTESKKGLYFSPLRRGFPTYIDVTNIREVDYKMPNSLPKYWGKTTQLNNLCENRFVVLSDDYRHFREYKYGDTLEYSFVYTRGSCEDQVYIEFIQEHGPNVNKNIAICQDKEVPQLHL